MKTIQSNFQQTNNSDVFNLSKTEDSLALSQTEMVSPSQRLKEKKRLEADRKAKELKD